MRLCDGVGAKVQPRCWRSAASGPGPADSDSPVHHEWYSFSGHLADWKLDGIWNM